MSYGALSGVRVLELANFVAGPLAGRILGDLGAEVVKIERLGRGDDGRVFPPFFGAAGAFYVQCNRNKRSVAIDLTTPKGLDVAKRLVDQSDVLLTNYRPGALARLGLDHEALRADRPALVYCYVSGYGAFGPNADRASYDASIQALSGLMRSSGSEEDRPLAVGPAVVDNSSAVWAVVAILAALRERDHTGRGQHVDVSLVGTAFDIMANDIMRYRATGARPQRARSGSLYRASDEGWVQLAIGNDAIFARVCEVVGHPELATDERFVTAGARAQHGAQLEEVLCQSFTARSAAEWELVLVAAGVPAAAVRHIDEVVDDVELSAGHVETCQDATGRELPQVRTPIDFGDGRSQVRWSPPALGADTGTVLQGLLGMSADEVEFLVQDGVVARAESAP